MTTDLLLVSRAADFAARRHASQKRKGEAGEPYLNHLAEVALLLAEAGAPPELVAAGWLHDTVEDTGLSPADLSGAFGFEVSALVLEVTDDKSIPKAERKRLQEQNAPHKSPGARRIKLADKTSNLRALAASPPAGWPHSRKVDYVDWAERVVAGCRGVDPHLEARFDEAVAQARTAIAANKRRPTGGFQTLYVPMRRAEDVVPHLAAESHWRDGYSAKALATSWFGAGGFPGAVRSALATNPATEELALIDGFFERKVDLGDGRRPSQTDLLAIAADEQGLAVVAVEGKVEESFGPTVSEWLRDASEAKETRLSNLCALLNLAREQVAHLRYQLLHRTASALLESGRYRAGRAMLLVHSFSVARSGFTDFVAFVEALGLPKPELNRIVGPIEVGGKQLFVGWVADQVPGPTHDQPREP